MEANPTRELSSHALPSYYSILQWINSCKAPRCYFWEEPSKLKGFLMMMVGRTSLPQIQDPEFSV